MTTFNVINPATEEVVETVSLTSAEETDEAIARASAALPAWKSVTSAPRRNPDSCDSWPGKRGLIWKMLAPVSVEVWQPLQVLRAKRCRVSGLTPGTCHTKKSEASTLPPWNGAPRGLGRRGFLGRWLRAVGGRTVVGAGRVGGDELRNDGLRDHRLGGGQVSFLPGQFGTVTAGVLDPI